jgi:glycosyltransferase involved in cell wall biosynthesis
METATHHPAVETPGAPRSPWPFRRITFFENSAHGDAVKDPEWPEQHPIGGSETATIRLAAVFRSLGFEVRILTRAEELKGHACDLFISCRVWQVFSHGIAPGKLNYLWCQDDANVPEAMGFKEPGVSERVLKTVDGIVFISHYQARRWIESFNIPAAKSIILSNGVPFERFKIDETALRRRPRHVFYSSTPFRGLHLLLQVWPEIKRHVPDSELHVFSSMKVYNEEDPADFKDLYQRAISLPGVRYHGSVGQAPLRDAIRQCRALAYPCVFAETGCIAAMEAMASGCAVVSTSLGALPETAWQNPLVPMSEGWLDQWMVELVHVLTDDGHYELLGLRNRVAARQFDWRHVAIRALNRFRVDCIQKDLSAAPA